MVPIRGYMALQAQNGPMLLRRHVLDPTLQGTRSTPDSASSWLSKGDRFW